LKLTLLLLHRLQPNEVANHQNMHRPLSMPIYLR
jgi:hypothetical protein